MNRPLSNPTPGESAPAWLLPVVGVLLGLTGVLAWGLRSSAARLDPHLPAVREHQAAPSQPVIELLADRNQAGQQRES
ncbi:MAG: hypothetical protein R3F33_04515 [Planctomycetota bacterium]